MSDKPHPYTEIGERLRFIREAAGFERQGDFAATIGVARTTYQNWEVGLSRPKPEQAAAILETYGVSLDFIFVGKADALSVSLRRAWNERPRVIASQ